MANSIHKDPQGPLWPLGNIVVATPGTPVSIMSLVDSTLSNAPENPTSYVSAAVIAEYTVRAYAIIFQACKSGAGAPKLTNNTGNVYIVRKALSGSGGVADTGTVLFALAAGGTGLPGVPFVLDGAALNRNTFSPYEIYVDADNAGDGVQVTLEIQ